MKIINLTQHTATLEQVLAGVIELDPDKKSRLIKALTFDDLPNSETLHGAAELVANIARYDSCWGGVTHAMIGGAPYLMPYLERALLDVGVAPIYAFSKRESVEEVQADGSVKKSVVFRHAGFVGI